LRRAITEIKGESNQKGIRVVLIAEQISRSPFFNEVLMATDGRLRMAYVFVLYAPDEK